MSVSTPSVSGLNRASIGAYIETSTLDIGLPPRGSSTKPLSILSVVLTTCPPTQISLPRPTRVMLQTSMPHEKIFLFPLLAKFVLIHQLRNCTVDYRIYCNLFIQVLVLTCMDARLQCVYYLTLSYVTHSPLLPTVPKRHWGLKRVMLMLCVTLVAEREFLTFMAILFFSIARA